MLRESPKIRGGIPRDLAAIDTLDIRPLPGKVYREFLPETSSCGGPIPPSMLRPRESFQGVPRGTLKGQEEVLEGVHALGSLRVLSGARY